LMKTSVCGLPAFNFGFFLSLKVDRSLRLNGSMLRGVRGMGPGFTWQE